MRWVTYFRNIGISDRFALTRVFRRDMDIGWFPEGGRIPTQLAQFLLINWNTSVHMRVNANATCLRSVPVIACPRPQTHVYVDQVYIIKLFCLKIPYTFCIEYSSIVHVFTPSSLESPRIDQGDWINQCLHKLPKWLFLVFTLHGI